MEATTGVTRGGIKTVADAVRPFIMWTALMATRHRMEIDAG